MEKRVKMTKTSNREKRGKVKWWTTGRDREKKRERREAKGMRVLPLLIT